MNETCPFCGIGKMRINNLFQWACGTIPAMKSKDYLQSITCKDRQIANLKAKLEAWRDLADIVRPMDELMAVQRLEDMGEL